MTSSAITAAPAERRVSTAPLVSWDGVPRTREWAFLVVSIAGFVASLPALSWPLYAVTFAAVYAIGVSGLTRRYRLLLVLAALGVYLAIERTLPRPDVSFVMWSGKAIRAFFILRAIDFALSKPRRELSHAGWHRGFQFLLFVTFLPAIFAGPITLFNDFYRQYLPASFLDRRAVPRHALKIAVGAVKFFALGPLVHDGVRKLDLWVHVGGGPDISLRLLMWVFMGTQIIDLIVRFSGFTDMAIGVSRLLGFQLEENFRYPLLARTPMEYWKSMHISVYRWLMHHVFYPTWGHRQLLLKIQTTFAASMLWHLAIARQLSVSAALQLLAAGACYATGVWLVARTSARAAVSPAPAVAASRGRRYAVIALQTAATFVFISFVNLIFRAGLLGRPAQETWSDIRLLVGPSVAIPHTGASAPVTLPTPFVRSDDDHLNALIDDVRVSVRTGGGQHSATPLTRLTGPLGLVIVTEDSTCDVSRRYGPRVATLEREYATRGVRFLHLAVGRGAAAQATWPLADSGIAYAVDPDGHLTRALGVRTSGEVFVVDARRTLVYRGAVDDQFDVAKARAEVERPYLADALEDLTAGRKVRHAATAAPGCALGADSVAASRAAVATTSRAPVTYAHQVSRIVQSHCLACHREGGAAPFSLESYEGIVQHADRIRVVLREGRMPPWFASPGSGPWANDPSLTAAEKETMVRWLDAGMPRGDTAIAPVARTFPNGWDIGAPDLVVELPEPQQLPASGLIEYRYLSVDVDLGEDKWVQAIQIRPGSMKNVHHMLVFLESPEDEPMAMHPYGKGTGALDESRHGLTSYFALYAPGTPSVAFPTGSAKRLPRKVRLVFQMHYVSTGAPATDRTKMGLVFAKAPPRFEVRTSAAYARDFVIPPQKARFPVPASYQFSEPGLLVSFLPHMHVRGTAFRYVLVNPDGTRRTLLDVPHWGFNWQVYYQLATPIPVQRGSRIVATAWYDNSAGNPLNPDPTKPVRWGMQSDEEMMNGYFDWIPTAEVSSGSVVRLARRPPAWSFRLALSEELLPQRHGGRRDAEAGVDPDG